MKHPICLLLLLFTFNSLLQGQTNAWGEYTRPATKPGIDIVFHYESPRDEIIVKDGRLTHIAKNHHYDENRPWEDTPVAVSRQTLVEARPLNGHQLQALEEMIKSSNFLYLPKSEYGASSGEEANPYSLSIRTKEGSKTIIYRGTPGGYYQAPEAFKRLEEYAWKLIISIEK